MTDTPKTITVDGTTLTIALERKHVKNINARLRGTTLAVSAPMNVAQADLDRVITELARRLLRRVQTRQVNAEEDALVVVQRVAARFTNRPVVAQVLFSTNQRARWGSYSATTRTIRLNAVLRHMPPWVLESVVAHELAHVTHMDHSPAFWALVRSVDQHVERADAFLAGVSWLGSRWETLPSIERAVLTHAPDYNHEGDA